MEYGAKKYLRYQKYNLEQPNIIINQDTEGDYCVKHNARVHDTSQTSEVLVGDDEIAVYLESALERFEDDGDVQAGLIAATIAHHFSDRYGEMPQEVCDEIAVALFNPEVTVDQLLMTVALDSHPGVVAAIETNLRELARHHTTLASIVNDPLIRTYVDARSGGGANAKEQAATYMQLLSTN